MTPETLRQAAAGMIAARDAGGVFNRLPMALRPGSAEDGYAVQDEVIRQRGEAGQALAGWKIGCTTKVMQEMLDLDSPSGGAVLVPNVLASPASVPASTLYNPVAECELAIRLASDVPARTGGHDVASVSAHVGTCMTAIELAELRHADLEATHVGELIADDFFQRAVVLGEERDDWQALDLAAVTGTTTVNGEVRGQGAGRDIMGHPFAALAWLADALAARGQSLQAGQIVLTGSMVAAAPLKAGETAHCTIDGLGIVSLAIN